jgi:hypothetical protein
VTNSLGPDPTATVTFASGLATLRLLTITLAVTPVRRLSPRLSWLVNFWRLLGLFAFFPRHSATSLATVVATNSGAVRHDKIVRMPSAQRATIGAKTHQSSSATCQPGQLQKPGDNDDSAPAAHGAHHGPLDGRAGHAKL